MALNGISTEVAGDGSDPVATKVLRRADKLALAEAKRQAVGTNGYRTLNVITGTHVAYVNGINGPVLTTLSGSASPAVGHPWINLGELTITDVPADIDGGSIFTSPNGFNSDAALWILTPDQSAYLDNVNPSGFTAVWNAAWGSNSTLSNTKVGLQYPGTGSGIVVMYVLDPADPTNNTTLIGNWYMPVTVTP
jgi:hypothetical protein